MPGVRVLNRWKRRPYRVTNVDLQDWGNGNRNRNRNRNRNKGIGSLDGDVLMHRQKVWCVA